MLVSKSIPNLFNGVSQQPAPMRHITQCELADNVYMSVSTGSRKRPPTEHKAKLKNATASAAFAHVINKDQSNRFVVIITSGAVEVFDAITGVAHTVTYPDGVPAMLTSASPRDDFVAMTAVDYTFIANKNTVVAMDAATTAGAITGTKQQFSSLPGAPAVGDVYRIEGTPDSTFDDYYVKWDGSVWVEATKPGEQYRFDAATMPWKLIKTGSTTWEFRKNVWDDRLVGDNISNPPPSFVGSTIRDIFYSRNRLGFLSDDNVIESRSGKPFAFWNETVTAVLDSDPIDRAVTHNKVSVLNWAVPFNKALLLFSGLTQFQLGADGVLTPRSVSLDPTTEFEASDMCRPVSAGNSVFFPVQRSNSSQLREYYVEKDTVSNDATDITAHVPTYIPKDVFRLTACNSEDLLMAAALADRNKVWVYKYLWGEDGKKAQSAWGRFVFDAADTVLAVEFIGSAAVFVIQRADGIYLESMDMEANREDTGMGFLVHLDRRVALLGAYDAANDWTTWTLPYADSASFGCVLGTAFGVDAGNSLTTTRPDSTHIRASGNWSAGTCFIGRNYTMRYRFSTIYLRDDQGVSITNGKLKLKRMFVNYRNTGYFRAEVTPRGRSMYTYEFTGKYVGDTEVDALTIKEGTFSFAIGCENIHATIDLVSDSYLPAFLLSAEWEGEFTIKSARK